ncbi:MAG: cytochrome c5 family protein [Betaproteobacteria bacterium]|nr:cytochrome c5 family protein [Betaproteobacteria bacterium]
MESGTRAWKRARVAAPRAAALALMGAGTAAARQSGEQVYKPAGIECRTTGLDKAPEFGDRKDWATLVREGQVRLTAEGLAGMRKMPARGGKPELTLAEFADAVAFMEHSAGATGKDPDEKLQARIAAEEKKPLDRSKAKKSCATGPVTMIRI